MFKVDLNKVGCGQKVRMRDVGILSKTIGIELSSDTGCTVVGDAMICSSIDRIGRMLSDINQFCEVAILHAVSDLTVSNVNPQCASVCIEYGPEFDTVEKMAALSKSLSDCFGRLGIELQNLHSVRSDYTHLTISVFGTREHSQIPTPNSGSVLISRRLGAAKMSVLREIENDDSAPFTSEIVSKRFLGGMVTEYLATDITGFGLAGAAINLANRVGARVQISLCDLNIVHEDVLGIPVRCFEADGIPTDAFIATCRRSKAVALCAEFAGPALFFVASTNVDDFIDEFRELHGWDPIYIGEFRQEEPHTGVSISWRD